jgi:hypothetical protein
MLPPGQQRLLAVAAPGQIESVGLHGRPTRKNNRTKPTSDTITNQPGTWTCRRVRWGPECACALAVWMEEL